MEIAVIPLRGVRGPSAFDAAGHSVAPDSSSDMVHPAETLLFYVCCLRCGPKIFSIAIAVCFANGVATCCQCNSLFIIHRHTGEGQAHVLCGTKRIWCAVHALWVHINQTHLHGSERICKGLAIVTFVTTRT